MPAMTRRRSARLASASKTPSAHAAPPALTSLAEQNEPAEQCSPAVQPPRTPASSSPAKPSLSEMHPGKSYTAAVPPSSALRFGFVDIPANPRSSAVKSHAAASDEPNTPEAQAARLQATPSKIAAAPPTSDFTFRFTRQSGDLALSDDARRMMEELREEALKIRADLEVQREQERAKEAAGEYEDANGRRIAKPKSRASRFSAAHSAQFQKMDSIANHPSAFRAARFTPVKVAAPAAAAPATTPVAASALKRGLKRTQSKANLDETPKQTRSAIPAAAAASATKKLFHSGFGSKGDSKAAPAMSAVKRARQHIGDDASSRRPMSRDGSALPRPAAVTSTFTASSSLEASTRPGSVSHHLQSVTHLLTPTKASLARASSVKTHGTAGGEEPKTPGKLPVPSSVKSATASSLKGSTMSEARKGKSIFDRLGGGHSRSEKNAVHAPANTAAKRCALPIPLGSGALLSKTPAPPRVNKPLPPFPATTPRRKLVKHVSFTPSTQRAILSVKSPSLSRSAIPRSTSKTNLRGAAAEKASEHDAAAAAGSPSVRRFGSVLYPDLSGHHLLSGLDKMVDEEAVEEEPAQPETSAPGTFTFRSDKTISFGPTSPTGFGSSPGQSSVRQVRPSTAPTPSIPGSFPGSGLFSALIATEGNNKENAQPVAINIPHGIANKKRHRVSAAEEEAEREATDRAAKKRKNETVAEGEALMAPRLVGKGCTGSLHDTPRKQLPHAELGRTPSKTPASAKKRPVLSLSRLNSLARPKLRK